MKGGVGRELSHRPRAAPGGSRVESGLHRLPLIQEPRPMVKKLEKLSADYSSAAELPLAASDSAQRIWLAGLGAFAKAQEEGGKVFEALVKEGLSLQRKSQLQTQERMQEATDRMTTLAAGLSNHTAGPWDKLETLFEQRVAKALPHLGIPSANQVELLSRQVSELAEQVRRLASLADARTDSARKPRTPPRRQVGRAAPQDLISRRRRTAASANPLSLLPDADRPCPFTMPKKAPRRTAERILEVSLQLFNRFGEPNVSTTLISAELGISPGNLYYHFPAKDALITQLFERHQTGLHELLAASDAVRDVEDAWFFVHSLFEQVWQYRFLYRDLNDLLSNNRQLETQFKQLIQRAEQAMRELLDSMQQHRALQIDASEVAPMATRMVMIATYWLSYEYVCNPRHALEPQSAQDALLRGADHVLGLLLPYLETSQRSHLNKLASAYRTVAEHDPALLQTERPAPGGHAD